MHKITNSWKFKFTWHKSTRSSRKRFDVPRCKKLGHELVLWLLGARVDSVHAICHSFYFTRTQNDKPCNSTWIT